MKTIFHSSIQAVSPQVFFFIKLIYAADPVKLNQS